MKIGELVKNHIVQIFNYCEKENSNELMRLMDIGFSNEKFRINFPFCKEISDISDENSKRYWTTVYSVNGKKVRVTSQWVMNSKYYFLNYLQEHKIISHQKYDDFDKAVQPILNVPLPKKIGKIELFSKLDKQDKFKELNSVNNSYNSKLVTESVFMGRQYEKFYCLERSIRELVKTSLEAKYGETWWDNLDFDVKNNVKNNLEYELDTALTKRSEHKIDYSTFGDLRKIINSNWGVFQYKFNRNLKSVNEVMIDLNRLRVSIAHCTPLAKKEINRLDIRIDDWFDLLKDV